MSNGSFFRHLLSIRHSKDALQKEEARIANRIGETRGLIEDNVHSECILRLLTSLGTEELLRVEKAVDYQISDFAGYARFLRGLAAKKSFRSWEPSNPSNEMGLLDACESLWKLIFFHEMIRGSIRDIAASDERRPAAGMMNILSAFQAPLAYIEDFNERTLGLYGPFTDNTIEPAIGVSVSEVIEAFEALRRIIPKRLDAIDEKVAGIMLLHQFHNEAPSDIQTHEQMQSYLHGHPLFKKAQEDLEESFSLRNQLFVFTPDDFRDCLGIKANAFLESFSFQPGTVNATYALPFDESIHRSRPFARIDNGYFLVDPVYCYQSPYYRLNDCFSNEQSLARLHRHRDKELEDVADRLFARVIGSAERYRSYYIPVNDNGDLAERDLLIIHNGVAFIVESKARPLRDAKGDINKLEGDFKRTIQEGYDQCVSVCECLCEPNKVVRLFDSNKKGRKVLAEIHTNSIRQVVPIVFLDSYYGLISTDLSQWLKVSNAVGFPWAVDRDAMSSFSLKFSCPEKFVQFLDWRRSVYGIAHNEDELCFAGYFLKHGSTKFPSEADVVRLDQNYSDIFEEEYFRRNGHDIPKRDDFVGSPYFAGMERNDENDIVFFESTNLHSTEDDNDDCNSAT